MDAIAHIDTSKTGYTETMESLEYGKGSTSGP